MKESQIREHLTKGWIRAIITFEIVGKPAKHVDEAMTQYIENIKKDSRIIVLQEERDEVIEHEDGMFSTFTELEMLVKNLETFTWLCINFSPASVEVIEPDELSIEAREVTNWLNDLLSKVHEIGTNYRSYKAASDHLTLALNELIKNSVLLAVRDGAKSGDEIGKLIGIEPAQLAPFLKHLIEKDKLALQNKLYMLPDPSRKIAPAKVTKIKRK
jgi:hypothetical protein